MLHYDKSQNSKKTHCVLRYSHRIIISSNSQLKVKMGPGQVAQLVSVAPDAPRFWV